MRPTTEDILEAASLAYGMSVTEITQRTRKREILRPRQVVHFLCKRLDTDDLMDIARKTKMKQHGTVLNSYNLIDAQSDMYRDVGECRMRIEGQLLLMGFDLKPYKRTCDDIDIHSPGIGGKGRHIPVKVLDTETGEYKIANSLRAAGRISSKRWQAIRLECLGGYKVRGKFKFSYDV